MKKNIYYKYNMSHKRGSKTITGEDELEVDVINILSTDGLEIQDFAGVAGNVLQKSSVTNEIEWNTVPPPENNSITTDMLQDNCVETSKVKDLNITTGKIGNLQVTDGKIANTTITGGKLATDIAISTTGNITGGNLETAGILTLKNGAGDDVLKINAAQSGISAAGFGNIVGGPAEQYGVLIDENPLSGTYQKAVIFGNTLEAIVPANGGTGWFPLQVKEYDGAAGNLFKVDIDGNTTCALKLSCNNLDVDSGAATISAAGVFNGTELDIGTGVITSGNINCNNIDTNNKHITMGTGDLTCDTIGSGAITSTTINTQNNNITMGTGDLTCDTIGCGAITSTTINTQNNNISMGTGDLSCDDISAVTIQGSAGDDVTISDANLLSTTNRFMPHNVYYDDSKYKLPFTAGIFHPNDDSTYYNYCLDDDGSWTTGRGMIKSTSLEVIGNVIIPRDWVATHIFLDIRDSSGNVITSSPPSYNVYKINTIKSGGTLTARADMTGMFSFAINTENSLLLSFTGVYDFALTIDIHMTSTSHFIGGGYFVLTAPS